jgi:hypothetical protein
MVTLLCLFMHEKLNYDLANDSTVAFQKKLGDYSCLCLCIYVCMCLRTYIYI